MPHIPEDYISAYLDGALEDAEYKRLEHLLASNHALEAEYQSVKAVKNLLCNRASRLRQSAPPEARHSVHITLEQEYQRTLSLTRIADTTQTRQAKQPIIRALSLSAANTSTSGARQFIYTLWEHRSLLAAAVVVLVLCAGIMRFLLRNFPTPEQTQKEVLAWHKHRPQSSNAYQCTFVKESLQNYEAVTSGKITLQYATNSFEELDHFFRQEGIHYRLVHPRIAGATLLGGVVSEEHGRKSAHLVFSRDKTLLYMWQMEETPRIIKHLAITPEAWRLLQQGEWLWDTTASGGTATVVFWEDGGTQQQSRTMCAIVSAMSREQLQPLFH